MSTTLQRKLESLTPQRRVRVVRRAEQLIAEELLLRQAAQNQPVDKMPGANSAKRHDGA